MNNIEALIVSIAQSIQNGVVTVTGNADYVDLFDQLEVIDLDNKEFRNSPDGYKVKLDIECRRIK